MNPVEVAALKRVEATLKQGTANVRAGKPGVLSVDSEAAQEFEGAYLQWTRARWDAGHAWTRSVWKERP